MELDAVGTKVAREEGAGREFANDVADGGRFGTAPGELELDVRELVPVQPDDEQPPSHLRDAKLTGFEFSHKDIETGALQSTQDGLESLTVPLRTQADDVFKDEEIEFELFI